MTDKKYTLTEGQLADLYNSAPHRTFYRWLAHLTPDPSPSGDVVDAVEQAFIDLLAPHNFPLIRNIASRLTPIIESEVQRRMDGVERYTANVSKCQVRRSGVVIFVDDLTPKGAKHE